MSKKHDDMSIHFDTVPAWDRQTERRAEQLFRILHAMYADAR